MKKKIILIIINSYMLFSCIAQNFYVNQNFNSMNFEIFKDEKKILELPFRNYSGYQISNYKIFFIDKSKTKFYDYGELCYFDIVQNKMVYTDIFSGDTFYISKNEEYIITSSLLEVNEETDIDDIFGFSNNIKKYPLNISIYNFSNHQLVKELNLSHYYKTHEYKNYYLNFQTESNQLNIAYGIYDIENKVMIGKINLTTLDFSSN